MCIIETNVLKRSLHDSHVATRMMTQVFQSFKGVDHIIISWIPSQYKPRRFKLLGYCRYLCSRRSYTIVNHSQPPSVNSTTLHNLQPGSMCAVTFFALYNYATIDLGVDMDVTTLHSSRWCLQKLYYLVCKCIKVYYMFELTNDL